MVKSCSAYGCSNRMKKGSGLHFFIFPLKREKVLKKWLRAIKRKNFFPSKHAQLCSIHFTENDFVVNPGSYRKLLKEDAVPSIFPGLPERYQPKPKKILIDKNEDELNASETTTSDDITVSSEDK